MSKPVILVLLLALSVVTAGVFGALHNQLSYSVGSSYFHDLKFAQFAIPENLQNRLGAALVGWRASWWMGLVVGLPGFVLGFVLIGQPARYLAAGISAILGVIIVTVLFSMGGLVLGMIAPQFADQLPLPEGVTDSESFLRAALMHEASYLGGLAGIVVTIWLIWTAHRAEQKARRAKKTGDGTA